MSTQAMRRFVFSMPDTQTADQLQLRSLEGEEAIGQLFCYRLDLLSPKGQLAGEKLLGQTATVSCPERNAREFNGIVTCVTYLGKDLYSDTHAYRLELRPRLWLLTQARHCRFFNQLTVPGIIQKVLEACRINVKLPNSTTYPKLQHCAQYNETDFDFFSRLLEREGIFYFFQHTNGRDTLVLADNNSQCETLHLAAKLNYLSHYDNGVQSWEYAENWAPGACELNSYNFENVTGSKQRGLLARTTQPGDNSGIKRQDHHGAYDATSPQGERYARLRQEAWRARADQVWASTTSGGVIPGGLFTLEGDPGGVQGNTYLVTQASYRVTNPDYYSSAQTDPPLQCRFYAIPGQRPFRMPLRTPPPLAVGPQTAFVVGAKEGEVHTDKYGRIQVQFHWEQFDPAQSSEITQRCWVRVAQNWAGKGWGTFFLPRVGQEVVIEFINGDIDQPLVTGCVYNAAYIPPYALPAQGAVSVWRTQTLNGKGFNELRLNDAAGKEQVFLHAERDLKHYVKNDVLTWVGAERHLVVEGEQRTLIGKDQHSQTTGDRFDKIGGQLNLGAGTDLQLKANKNMVLNSANFYLKTDGSLVIEADSLTIKAGGSFITMGRTGVNITGKLVKLNTAKVASARAKKCDSNKPKAPSPSKTDDGSKEMK